MSSEKIGQADPFASILAGTGAHREKHGCWAYPFDNGPLLGVMAATKEARRIVEFGTALGYSALWFAYGAQKASVDTIDKDPEHVRLAQKNINQAGFGDRIRIHQGSFLEVSRTFEEGHDLAFLDRHSPTLADWPVSKSCCAREVFSLPRTSLSTAAKAWPVAKRCQ